MFNFKIINRQSKTLIQLIILILVWSHTQAQVKIKHAYFSGHINTNLDSSSMYVNVFENSLGFTRTSYSIKVPVDSHGNFAFTVSGKFLLSDPVRIDLFELESAKIVLDKQIVESGDSVSINVNIDTPISGNDMYSKNGFQGRGVTKYECAEQLNNVSIFGLNTVGVGRVPYLMDSLLKVRLAVLEKYRTRLSSTLYYTLRRDEIAKVRDLAMRRIKNFDEPMENNAVFQLQQKVYNKIVADEWPMPDSLIAFSPFYDRYLENKAIRQMQFERKWKSFTYEDYYHYILTNFSGLIRDKILAFSIFNESTMCFYDFKDPNNYSRILADAEKIIHTPSIKEAIRELRIIRGRGAPAFNFTLPADSTNQQVSLADFKGKVVLIDMWGYHCTGCYKFANIFHKKVYPLFKNNPNFKVISIMLHGTPEQYTTRLRRQKGPAYTFPEYINLFGGDGIKMGRALEKHYHLPILPFLLLIDKKGEIYSSRIPFFVEMDSPQIDKLILLIKKALNEN